MTGDVVMADIPGQALEIFLHGPESAHKNGIVKTNIHSHIHSYSPIHTPKRNKEQNHELTKLDDLLVLFLSILVVVDGHEAWQILLRTVPRWKPSRLGQY